MLLYVLGEIWTGDKGKTKNEEQKKKTKTNVHKEKKMTQTTKKECVSKEQVQDRAVATVTHLLFLSICSTQKS